MITNFKADPDVMTVSKIPDLLDALKQNEGKLSECSKGVDVYVESMRTKLYRLFCASNSDIIEILSASSLSLQLVKCFTRCFQGIAKLEFDKDLVSIVAIVSQNGERVQLNEPCIVSTDIGRCLEEFEVAIQQTLALSFRSNLLSFKELDNRSSSLTNWIFQGPGQIVQDVMQLYWTMQAEQAMAKEDQWAMRSRTQDCESKLNQLSALVRTRLPGLSRKVIVALVVLLSHHRDVSASLQEVSSCSAGDIEWLMQLRHYYSEDAAQTEKLSLHVVYASAHYGYEYLGNCGRIVMTPLTTRCYYTLMNAFQCHYGSALQGPCAAGKTETAKGFAKALATQYISFNCSSQPNFHATARMLRGAASCGAFLCLEELDCLTPQVLSVIGHQIRIIQHAAMAQKTKFDLEGEQVIPRWTTFAVITTLNAALDRRSELPCNLVAALRPCSMMKPDLVMILEVSLLSEAFVYASSCAQQILAVHRACAEEFFAHREWSFGLQESKSVIRAGASLLEDASSETHTTRAIYLSLDVNRELGESQLIWDALVHVHKAQFSGAELDRFETIMKCAFPQAGKDRPTAPTQLTPQLNQASIECGVELNSKLCDKILQLHDSLQARRGTIILGEAGVGKTTMYQVVAQALAYADEQPEVRVIYPKATSVQHLWGHLENDEWIEGLLTNVLVNVAKSTDAEQTCAWFTGKNRAANLEKHYESKTEVAPRWIVFDGAIDPFWADNLNSLLDHDTQLSLSQGVVLPLMLHDRFIFEASDVTNASPATISRLGVVHTSTEPPSWRYILSAWLLSLDESVQPFSDIIKDTFSWMFAPLLAFVQDDPGFNHSSMSPLALVQSTLKMLAGLLQDQNPTEIQNPKLCVECFVLWAIVWSIGTSPDAAALERLDEFARLTADGTLAEMYGANHHYVQLQPMALKMRPMKLKFMMPNVDADGRKVLMYDWTFCPNTRRSVNGEWEDGNWLPWCADELPKLSISRQVPFHSIVVPTDNLARCGRVF